MKRAKKKTIYAAMTGGFGSLAQVLPILAQLDPDEFRVVYSIAHGAAHALQQLHYEFIPYPDVGQPQHVTPKGRTWCDLDQYWGRFGFADEQYFTRLIEARLEIIRELNPDILLTQFCPPTEVMARITGLPLVCVTQSCWHPAGKPLDWWQRHTADYTRVTPVVNAVLQRYGAGQITRMEALNQGDLTIIPGFPEFDPVNADVLYTGPLHWDSSGISTHRNTQLAAFDPAKTILVYTGHLYDSAGESGMLILEQVAAALGGAPYNVIITTGLDQQPGRELALADNIHLFDWLPLHEALRHCRLFIHHGGHGSCMAAAQQGIPSLVIPTFQEREFNARQLALLGLGDFILPGALTPQALYEKIEVCLNDPSLFEQARRWQHTLRLRRYDGAVKAAEAIRSLSQQVFGPTA